MHFRGLDLNLLVALDALLDERSVTAAGRKLHLSQSATSSALGRLRRHFGDKLLISVGRHMELTPYGLKLSGAVRLSAAVTHTRRSRNRISAGQDSSR